MAGDRQRLGRRCAGGADGDLPGAVLYWPLGMELIDMKTNFEMAKEAGLRDSVNLERFAALIRADEREAILAIEASSAFNRMYGEFCPKAKDLADAIRARGNT